MKKKLYIIVIAFLLLSINSSLVISIGGTVSLEAAFYQKPSIIVSDLGFSVLPSIQKLNSFNGILSSSGSPYFNLLFIIKI